MAAHSPSSSHNPRSNSRVLMAARSIRRLATRLLALPPPRALGFEERRGSSVCTPCAWSALAIDSRFAGAMELMSSVSPARRRSVHRQRELADAAPVLPLDPESAQIPVGRVDHEKPLRRAARSGHEQTTIGGDDQPDRVAPALARRGPGRCRRPAPSRPPRAEAELAQQLGNAPPAPPQSTGMTSIQADHRDQHGCQVSTDASARRRNGAISSQVTWLVPSAVTFTTAGRPLA